MVLERGSGRGGVEAGATHLTNSSSLPPGAGHPMKPHRLALTHSLVLHYGLYKKMIVSSDASSTGDGGWGRAAALKLGRPP